MAPKVVHHRDVGLETGSSYSAVCVIDGDAVSNAKLGFMTTPSLSAPSLSLGDVTKASFQARFEDVGLETGNSHNNVCVIDGHAVQLTCWAGSQIAV